MSKNEQPESEITEFDKLELFVTKHTKSILLSVGGVILAVAIGVVIYNNALDANKESIANITKAESVEELQAVIKSEASNKTVVTAQIRLAKKFVEDKKYVEAGEVYSAILASSAVDTIKNRVKLNQAALLEVEGKMDEAAVQFKALAGNATLGDDVRAEARFAVARLLVAQDKAEEAKKELKELVAGTTAWKTQADLMLKRL